MDEGQGERHEARQTRCAFLALRQSLERPYDYLLFLEDDLAFNRHLRHNLQHWRPLQAGTVKLASLYNPALRELACDTRNNARLVTPDHVFGSQAFLISRRAVRHIVRYWYRVQGMQDIRISRLAGRLGQPVFYHAPSLVQHLGRESLWGARFHEAMDFYPAWRSGRKCET
jgi:hypothetical protein